MLLSVVAGSDHKYLPMEGMRSLAKGDMRLYLVLKNYIARPATLIQEVGQEAFYHGLVLGTAVYLLPTMYLQRESGGGRYVALKPKNIQDKGVLLELKIAKQERPRRGSTPHQANRNKSYATEMRSEA